MLGFLVGRLRKLYDKANLGIGSWSVIAYEGYPYESGEAHSYLRLNVLKPYCYHSACDVQGLKIFFDME